MVGIPEGAELTYVKEPSIRVVVVDDAHVRYRGEIYSLSGLAKKLNGNSKEIQGTAWFAYNGKRLTDLRDEMEAKL